MQNEILKMIIYMEALLVTAKNKTDLQFVTSLLKRMKIEVKALSNEDQEDLGLLKLMKQVDRSEKVSREKVMSKLNGK